MTPRTRLIVVLATGLTGAVLLSCRFAPAADAAPAPPAAAAPEKIAWLTSEPEALAAGKASGKPVLIDFGAEWCSSCMALEKRTYTDPAVRAKIAAEFIALKVDCTDDTPVNLALQKKYGVEGLPIVTFVDRAGRQMDKPKVDGFLRPKEFLAVLEEAAGR